MLAPAENELLTAVGETTAMGRLLRRFWLPALLATDLVADGPPRRVRLLGHRLVAFRDTDGRVGLLAEHCPHRGASLALGRNEQCGLRCLYHGWKLDVEGRVLETPAEQSETWKHRIRHIAYPVVERGGLIWAYLGPADETPAVPRFEWFALPADHVYIAPVREECNWVQALEGVLDPAHASYLHADTFGTPDGLQTPGSREERAVATSGDLGRSTRDGRPRLEVVNTSYGFKCAALRRPVTDGDSRRHVRISHFVAPFYGVFPAGAGWGNLQAFVPMDDTHTMQYFIAYNLTQPIGPHEVEDLMIEAGARVGVDIDSDYRKLRTPENNWLQDRELMATGASFSGIEGIGNEDMVVQESMGPIFDRSKEHIGPTDLAVIRMRRLLLDSARRVQRGESDGIIGGVQGAFDELERVRGLDTTIGLDDDWRDLEPDAFDGSAWAAAGERNTA